VLTTNCLLKRLPELSSLLSPQSLARTPTPTPGNGVIGNGFLAAGVLGLISAAVLAFASLSDCALYTLIGKDIWLAKGLSCVTGASRSGLILVLFLSRGGFNRASAAAMSIETLEVDLECDT
jgi:hypothetical protein